VGAATIAFVLLNTLFLRPLPVENPGELVYLEAPSFSYPIIREVRARSWFFTKSFAWNLEQYDVVWGNEPEPTLVLQASGTIHEALGVSPFLGRLLMASDDGTSAAGAQAVGVISHGAWQRRLGGDPAVIGRVVRLQGVPITILGVSPPHFFGVAPGRAPELTVPVTLTGRLPGEADVLTEPAMAWLHFMGRLRPGLRAEQVDPEFQVVWRQVLAATTSPELTAERRASYLGRRTALMPGATGYSSVRNQFREPLTIVAGLAVLLLLVGCATVANLLLAGTWGRSRELAVRLALGCSRVRLARQLLIEGLLLASTAAVAAVFISQWAAEALVALLTTALEPVNLDVAIDWRVGVFAVAVVVGPAIVFSAAPIVMAMRVEPGPALKSGSGQAAAQGGRVGRALVAVQVALSVALLIGAALFLRSLGHLMALDPGFDSSRLLIVRIDPSQLELAEGPTDRASTLNLLYRNVLDSLQRTSEVVSASVSLYPPISDEDGAWTQSVGANGAPPVEESTRTFFNAVSPGFFRTIGTALIAGRDFGGADRHGAERVVIVNETLAARMFPGQNPLGRRITVGRAPSRENLTIVGLVADAKYQRLQEPTRSIAYLPYLQDRQHEDGTPLFASIRVARVSDDSTAAVRHAIAATDPRLTPRVERLTDRIRESLVNERLLAVLAAALAGCALFLASAGLMGLMTHLVARRTREIGIRIALGASALKVLHQVLGQTLSLAAVGLGLGLAIGFGAGGWIRSVLHGVSPTDPIAFFAVTVLTLTIALCAGLIPARRAASVDPVVALRVE
jgi:predicted permease